MNFLEDIFIFISQIKEGMKWLIISIAWTAQILEWKVTSTTLKVKGLIPLLDRIILLIIENFQLIEKEFYLRGGLTLDFEGHNLSVVDRARKIPSLPSRAGSVLLTEPSRAIPSRASLYIYIYWFWLQKLV